MPEGPELHLTSLFINRLCKGHIFSGKVVKNPIHKCAEVDWESPAYTISAETRGKEFMLHLNSVKDEKAAHHAGSRNTKKALSILVRFGMGGKFEFTPANALLKHSHLTFFTKDGNPKMALSFVDPRRFGKWIGGGTWAADRGPCVIQEYDKFVDNIVCNLNKPLFNKPICELMLDQRYFNGIGNYLRAEILYRCKVPPFEGASSVLKLTDKGREKLDMLQKSVGAKQKRKGIDVTSLQENKQLQQELSSLRQMLTPKAQELLKLCNSVPLEAVKLGSSKYSLPDMYKRGSGYEETFYKWLRCYSQPGMKNITDHKERTMWFSGPVGSLAPQGHTVGVKKVKESVKSDGDVKVSWNKDSAPRKGKAKSKKTGAKQRDVSDDDVDVKRKTKMSGKAGKSTARVKRGSKESGKTPGTSEAGLNSTGSENEFMKPAVGKKRGRKETETEDQSHYGKKAKVEVTQKKGRNRKQPVTRASLVTDAV